MNPWIWLAILLVDYLVNKPLPAAGISADNVRGWEIVRKMNVNIWPRSEASRANVKFWGESLSQGHYQPMYQQAGKGFIYFITPPLIFFAIKPRVNMVKKPVVIWWLSGIAVVTSFLMSLSLHSLKRVWFPSMFTEEKKSWNSSADCFSSTETIRGQISTRAGLLRDNCPAI